MFVNDINVVKAAYLGSKSIEAVYLGLYIHKFTLYVKYTHPRIVKIKLSLNFKLIMHIKLNLS